MNMCPYTPAPRAENPCSSCVPVHTDLKYTYTHTHTQHSYSYLRRWGFSASAFLSPHYRIVRRLPPNPHRGYKRLLHNCTTFSQTQNIVAVFCLCYLIWLFFSYEIRNRRLYAEVRRFVRVWIYRSSKT